MIVDIITVRFQQISNSILSLYDMIFLNNVFKMVSFKTIVY